MAVDTLPPLDFEDVGIDDDAVLADWYEIYAKSFPNPGEQEPLSAFKNILRMNGDKAIQDRFGPYREYLIAIRDPATKKVVGGLNFGVMTSQAHRDAGFIASVHAIFLFIDIRGRLTPRRVLHEINRRAITAFEYPKGADVGGIAIFFEANDPLAMTEEQRREDVDFSGTDPFRRYKGWLDAGASPLDFEYVQPALDHDKHPVDFLDLFYLGKGRSVSPKMLQEHLYKFVSVSVLKGRDARENPEYQKMVHELSAMQVVPLLNREESRKLLEIERKAKEIRADRNKPKGIEQFPPQKLPGGERSRRSWWRNLGWRALDRCYQAGYSLYHFLERQHEGMVWFELLFGGGALALTILSHLGKLTSWPVVSEWLDAIVIIALSSYVIVQGIVRSRRSHLGNRFDSLWKELGIGDLQRPGERDDAYDWLKNQMLDRLKKLGDYGPVSSAPDWEGDRQRWLSRISDYSSMIYSDRHVFGAVDENWRRQDIVLLEKAIQSFPDALWAFKTEDCPGHIFCNLVVPIRPSSQPGQIDLNHLDIDQDVAARLGGHAPAGPPGHDGKAGPYLLILRQLDMAPAAGRSRAPEIEEQFALVLSMLLRIAMIVEKISDANNIRRGVPRNCTLLSISASADSAKLLKWLGFSLLQRPPAHGSVHGDHDLAQSNLSLYGMSLGGQDENAVRMREWLLLLNASRRRFSKP